MKIGRLYLQLQLTALPQVNQHLSAEYLKHRQMTDKDPPGLSTVHRDIGMKVLKRIFNHHRVDIVGKSRNNSTGSSDINAEVRHDLGRGQNSKIVASTGNKRQKQTFRKDEERSIKTSSTHQKRSRTAHLQLKSTKRPRASTDRWYVVPRGSDAAETVINVPPAERRRAQALSADTRSITTATVQGRRAAISANKCRVINNPFMEKIKIAETTAFAEICEKKIHKHQFRRKKRQKNRRNSQGE